MKNKLISILIITILASLIRTESNNIKSDEKQTTTELPDEYLDPQDIAEYELEKLKTENSFVPDPTTTTLETSTTTVETTSSINNSTLAKQEEEQDKKEEEEISSSSTTITSTTTSKTVTSTSTIENIELKPNKKTVNIFNYEINTIEYREIVVERVDDKQDLVIYDFKAIKELYQIELLIDVQNKHLDFNQCAISLNDSNFDCITSYIEILNSKFMLRIKRHLLPSDIKLKLRLVLSGCDTINRLRDIQLIDNNLPVIYHNSDHDCIYRIENTDVQKFMMMIRINSFPVHEDRICHASMHISNSNTLDKKDYNLQAVFETHDSIIPFEKNGILVGSKYVMIKLSNCFENNEPIEIRIDQVKMNYKNTSLGETEMKYFYRLDSSLLMSNKLDTNLLFELVNFDSRDLIDFKLSEYKTKCDQAEDQLSTSEILIYGQNLLNQMFVKQFNSCAFNTSLLELRGFKRAYIQFIRDPFRPNSNLKPDNFVIEFNLRLVKKFYKFFKDKVGLFRSETDLVDSDLRNQHLDFEIQAPMGHRIVLNISKFSNGRFDQTEELCTDYAIIKLNRTTNRIDSLIEKNPILCNRIESSNFQIYSSFSNRLFFTFVFAEIKPSETDEFDVNELDISKPEIEFTYFTEPLCDNVYTRSFKKLISFSSLESVVSDYIDENIDCYNTIKLKPFRRVVLYKINWLSNQNDLISNQEEINTNFVNSKQRCQGQDSLLISNENPKYGVASQNQYCMDNPFYSFISDSNNVYLNFKRSTEPTHLVKPLILDLGYFSYKYLYTEYDDLINVNFSTIIPDNVSNKTKIDNLAFKIKLKSNSSYIYPIISDCFTDIKSGLVNIRSDQRSVPFKMSCANQTYTLMSSMENELSIEFINVNLKELKDSQVRFKLNYTILPRVFNSPNGHFETNNFEHLYINPSRESVEYNFLINLDPSYMIKLNIDELKNDFAINEFTIYDANTNENLYEQSELIENYKLNRKYSYLFSSNKIRISFKHMKENNAKLSKYPYLKCSYSAEPRIINFKSQLGEISLNTTLTKNVLDWLIIAPVDQLIVIKIVKFRSSEERGQLKFSLLNTGYSDNGIYHFNLNNNAESVNFDYLYERNTDLIVSKDNMIRIEYSSGGLNDLFRLEYSLVNKILSQPAGFIRQHYNNLTQPIIYVPKLTDQQWTIRAPYSKRIQVYTKQIDLLSEKPCSKASLSFYESNGTLIDSKCGHLDLKSNPELSFVTSSNELNVRFITQNNNDVVYLNTPPQFQLYQGFLYFYSFVEENGDCYFQTKKNFMCSYKNVGDLSWLVKGENLNPKYEHDFNKYFCTSCYLNAHVPLQSESGEPGKAVLVSPSISKSKKYLKFLYNLKNAAKLTVSLVTEKEFMNLDLNNALVLRVFNETSSDWKLARVRIGLQMFHDYRILFILEKADEKTQLAEGSLDNIEFFEQDSDCAVINDSTCSYNEQNLFVDKTKSTSLFCQKYSTPCDFNKCKNDAICINKEHLLNPFFDAKQETKQEDDVNHDDYQCLCSYGYTGKFCETVINPCELEGFHKCSANSKCVPSNEILMEYECKCDKHYFGKYCENKYEPCKKLSNPCNQLTGQGVCNDLGTQENPKNHSCTCSPMYSGPNCEFVIKDRCLNSECNKFDPKAVCIELEDRFVCKCSSGFGGPSCTNIDDCASSPCQNNGICIDGINSFKCKCDDIFEGKYCEKSKLCSKCDTNGTLFCDVLNPSCICRETHDGEFCENELDPCLTNPCANGDCVSNKTSSDFKCICHYGYKGKLCDKKESLCDQGLCQNGANCVLEMDDLTGEISYSCKCKSGFEGKNCENLINSCEKNQCKNSGTCVPSVNKFSCVCPPGYTGDLCENVINNCENSKCSHGSTCISVANSYICKCAPGFYGRYCTEEVDKCLKNECQNGKCIPNELDNNYRCNCMQGYTGKYCEINIDDCESNPCQNKAQCVDLLNSYKCICQLNFTGRNCESSINYCSAPETSCISDQYNRCIPIAGGNKCDCLPRYTGLRCEKLIDFCDYYKPCRNGKCKTLSKNEYICENCEPGFTGKNCSELIDYCSPINPCQNSGTCLSKPQGYFCKCRDGFVGKNCEEKVNFKCLFNKCKNNGICLPTETGYKCECDSKHQGTYCELKKKDLCKDVPCDDGYCVDGKCLCDPRIIYCKKNSQCHDIKCENGGTCVDVIEGDKTVGMCLCPPGLVGKFCEQSIYCNSTKALPCGSNKQCATVNQTYECNCEKPLIGHGCSRKISDYLPEYEQFLNHEKLLSVKTNCKFGKSKESKLLIGIIGVASIIFLIIGFILGHLAILKYKKKLELARLDKTNSDSNYGLFSDNDSMNFVPKTPLMKSRGPIHEITLNKSAGGFSIPRPSVRL